MDSEHHSHTEKETRWLCHVCHCSSAEGSGYVCRRCYKIACGEHIQPTRVQDESGNARLEMVCVECIAQEGDEA
ncbi:MAG: hypothetical protein ACP5FP_10305 [Desulfuromonadaceae bacterium]